MDGLIFSIVFSTSCTLLDSCIMSSDDGLDDASYNLNKDNREVGESSQILTLDELACIEPLEAYRPEPNEQFAMPTPDYVFQGRHSENDFDIGGHCPEDVDGLSHEFNEDRYEDEEDEGEDDVVDDQVNVSEDGTYPLTTNLSYLLGKSFRAKRT